MPEQRGPEERLQPALLDRLTDDEPGNRLESREARVFSKRRLRQAVLRDLAWLFNATQLEAGGDLSRTPLVRESVLNYGLPALSGTAASSLDVGDLAQSKTAASSTSRSSLNQANADAWSSKDALACWIVPNSHNSMASLRCES